MPKFYSNTHGALIVYSIVDRNSFDAVKDWLDELKRQTMCRFIMLVGNKNDLEDLRAVTKQQGQELASQNDMLFMETSAKEATNVDEAFSALIKEVFEDATRGGPKKPTPDRDDEEKPIGPTIVLQPAEPGQPEPAKRSCAC